MFLRKKQTPDPYYIEEENTINSNWNKYIIEYYYRFILILYVFNIIYSQGDSSNIVWRGNIISLER